MRTEKSRIGIFSGTFDPVHVGHIEFALTAAKHAKLETIYFLPEEKPREKSPTSLQHRAHMLQLSIEDHPHLAVLALQDQQFNIKDTLPQLQTKFKNSQLVFLMGSDVVKTFTYRWPGLQELLEQVELVIGTRHQDHSEELHKLITDTYEAFNLPQKYTLLTSPRKQLASTTIRAGKHTITDISTEVANYIKQHQLYSDASL